MVRTLSVLVALSLASPVHAVGPLVMVAHQLVQQIVGDFIDARIADSIRASFGPCKADLAQDAIDRTPSVTALLRGAGGAPNLDAIGNLGNFGNTGNLGAAAGALGKASDVAGRADADKAAGVLAPAIAGSAGSMDLNHLMQSAGGMPGMAGGADMQQAMAAMQQAMGGSPLDAAEMDDLALILERFGKVGDALSPGTGCSAGDYRRLFLRMSASSADPRIPPQLAAMTGGVLRMMYTNFKDMERTLAAAGETFGKMDPIDRAAYVETTVSDMKRRTLRGEARIPGG